MSNAATENLVKCNEYLTFRCDVTDRAAVMEMAQKVKREVGDVTILVNNAGIMPCKSLLDHTENEVRLMFGVNTLAHIWVS